jgi:hypothetical protein
MGLATRWLECGLCRHWSGFYTLDFRATRRIFLHELKVQVQADAGEIIRDSHPVIAAVCPPCELENIVAYLKKNFSQQQVREADDAELDEEDFCVESTQHGSATSFHEPPGLSVDTVLQVTTEQTGAEDGARHDHEMLSKDVARHSWDCDPQYEAMFELPASAPQDRPATKDGAPCSHYRRESPPPSSDYFGSSWVDYATNYNIVLVAAHQVSHSIVEITGPADEAGGVWECNVMTCIQTNSETKVERRIMRVVVTTSGS